MNITQNINKLLYALRQKEQFYKINTFKFYSENTDKYITKYQVLKKEKVNKKNCNELEEKYNLKKECYSKIDLLKYLIQENRKGSEAVE